MFGYLNFSIQTTVTFIFTLQGDNIIYDIYFYEHSLMLSDASDYEFVFEKIGARYPRSNKN